MKTIILALTAQLAITAPVLGQTSPRPAIVVVGAGHAEAQPDTFTAIARLSGKGADQVAALRSLSEAQTRLGSDLQALDGVEALAVSTSRVSVSPVHGSCEQDRYGEQREDCPVTGYVAAVDIQARGTPVSQAGAVVSLIAERGAESVTLDQFDLADRDALDAEASRLAFADARRQADRIAAASGQRITRVLRVEDPQNRIGAIEVGRAEDVVVTGSRIRPTVDLSVSPPPVIVRKQLSVVFEIE